jgi:Fur family ferric uptake transcriptional regulator
MQLVRKMIPATIDPSVAIPHVLARRGRRLTGPRRAVVEALATGREPMTVATIHASLRERRPNLASVYRAVNLLADAGLVRVTHTGRGRQVARYELADQFTGHHHHLICQACGRVEDLAGCLITDDALVQVSRRVREAKGFRVTEHELRLFGICAACRG